MKLLSQKRHAIDFLFPVTVFFVSYLTYLYAWDGQLRELYVKEGTTLSPSAGKSILPVKEFSVEETENQVITFRCTDTSGETAAAVYTIRSVSR